MKQEKSPEPRENISRNGSANVNLGTLSVKDQLGLNDVKVKDKLAGYMTSEDKVRLNKSASSQKYKPFNPHLRYSVDKFDTLSECDVKSLGSNHSKGTFSATPSRRNTAQNFYSNVVLDAR